MTLHKLTAGDGYTYLTRQVAVHDSTERGFDGLGDYYTQRGESPGVWMGSGLTHLPHFLGGTVTEEQMTALLGEGRHPDARRMEIEMRAAGHGSPAIDTATRLGSPFIVYETANLFRAHCAEAYGEHNAALGLPRDWAVPAEERAEIRTRIAREMFAAKYGRDPVEDRELSSFVARISRQATNSVAGYDLTFSPVKSVSALWGLAPRELAEVIEQAHRDAVADALGWLERTAIFTREGRQGVRQVETNGLLAAAFTHRDSRAGDPDLHTHVAISNKVQSREGRWLALDGRPLYKHAVAASERYNTRIEALLVERLGVRFANRDGYAPGKRAVREIVGMDQRLLSAWSRRRAAIEDRRAQLASDFQTKHGRPPTTVEAIALSQQANLETREAKHPPRSLAEQRSTWRAQAVAALGGAQAVTGMLDTVLHAESARHTPRATRQWVRQTAATVVDIVQQERATWQQCHVRAEAERQARAAGIIAGRLDQVVDRVVKHALSPAHSIRLGVPEPVNEPNQLRRSDGTSVYVNAGSQLYTSATIVAAERQLIDAGAGRDGPVVSDHAVDMALLESVANGVELNPGQAQLVRELATSPARAQLALAAAGTGKTAALRVLARAWASGAGPVIGLAPSAAAAAVLRDEASIDTDTIAKLLHGIDTEQLPDWAARIRRGTLVIVDEAGMAGTLDLARLVEFCLERDASVRLVGDDQQLASVAAGGALRDLADRHGAVHLSQVLRFADPAEGAASIALRAGNPAALGFYLDQRRVHVGNLATAAEQAYTAWSVDGATGRDSLLLAPTRELVAQLNARAQADRHARRGVPARRHAQLADGSRACAGDVILTRHNDRRLPISATDWVKNGDRWTVTHVAADGSLRVRHHGTNRSVTLPARYVAEHVGLGYAATVHAAQGVTADSCHFVATGDETRQLLYVGMTRGRGSNHVYLATASDGDPHVVIERDALLPPTAVDILTRVLARDGAHTSATSTATALAQPAARLHDAVVCYQDALHVAAESVLGRSGLDSIGAAAERVLPGVTSAPAWDTLRGHLALLALHDHDVTAVLSSAIAMRPLDGVADPAAVLDWRLDHGTTGAARPVPWLEAVPHALASDPTWGGYLGRCSHLVTELAEHVAASTSAWRPTTVPAWAAPLSDTDPHLLTDLAVWRAANGIEDAELDPVGPPARYAAEAAHQQRLRDRVARVTGDRRDSARWHALAERIDSRLITDPYWPQLAERLCTATCAGIDIHALTLEVAAEHGPLPDEQPAAALWWRLSRHLSSAVLAGDAATVSTLRPAWSSAMVDVLGESTAQLVLADPAWPALVAAVTTAAERGWTPGGVLATAYDLIDVAHASDTVLRTAEIATALVWRISMLSDPPADEGADIAEHEFADAGRAPCPTHEEMGQYGDAAAAMDEHWLDLMKPPEHTDSNEATTHLTEVRWVSEASEHDALYAYPAPSGVPAERLVELNVQAIAYFRRCYPGSWAPSYLADRLGADLATAAEGRFTPGYAPTGWDHLVHHLHRLGATNTELIAAGLASRARTGRLVDRFRDRLVFPIWHRDELHGFIARRNPGDESDEAGPKYLNTPDTDLFRKGAQLFGLHESRDLLADGAVPVLVEGPLDALAITLAGDGRHVGVAPLGTAFTDQQAIQLRSWIGHGRPGVIVATDNDPAGRRAAERAYWQLVARGDAPRRLTLPDGLDPADLLRYCGAGALRSRLANSEDLAHCLIDGRIDRYAGQLDTAEGTVFAARAAAEVIGALPPTHWLKHIEYVQACLPSAATGLMHLEVIDAGQAWTTDPFGRATDQLHARLPATAPASERWAELGGRIDTDLISGPDWLPLAEALDRASDSGYDVEHRLPALAASPPLPYRDAARELRMRLINNCPAAAPHIEYPAEARETADIRQSPHCAGSPRSPHPDRTDERSAVRGEPHTTVRRPPAPRR